MHRVCHEQKTSDNLNVSTNSLSSSPLIHCMHIYLTGEVSASCMSKVSARLIMIIHEPAFVNSLYIWFILNDTEHI